MKQTLKASLRKLCFTSVIKDICMAQTDLQPPPLHTNVSPHRSFTFKWTLVVYLMNNKTQQGWKGWVFFRKADKSWDQMKKESWWRHSILIRTGILLLILGETHHTPLMTWSPTDVCCSGIFSCMSKQFQQGKTSAIVWEKQLLHIRLEMVIKNICRFLQQ